MAKTIKVNVWQVGFESVDDWKQHDNRKAKCRPMGYVEMEECEKWEDEVWHLLNWGCWNYDDKSEKYVKPTEVHSPLTHCNSDVILQVEGTQVYRCAKSFGWGTHVTLKYAIRAIKNGHHSIWPFSDAK